MSLLFKHKMHFLFLGLRKISHVLHADVYSQWRRGHVATWQVWKQTRVLGYTCSIASNANCHARSEMETGFSGIEDLGGLVGLTKTQTSNENWDCIHLLPKIETVKRIVTATLHYKHSPIITNPKQETPFYISALALPPKPPTRLFGMRASDIDKYSRVIFPIMFVTFHLMYWMIYLSLAGDVPEDIVYLQV